MIIIVTDLKKYNSGFNMIKTEDLKIGDLVKTSCNCEIPKGTVCIVSGIRKIKALGGIIGAVSLISINSNDDSPSEVWCSDIESIPLTLEILKKNGWDITKHFIDEDGFEWYVYANKDNCINIQYYPYNKSFAAFYIDTKMCDIKHVHKFQHILWALGENANLKI